MIPAAFDYVRAASVEEATRALMERPGAKLLAGGHSLLPLMKLRLSTPACLIDLGGVSALRGIRREGGSLAIGALTCHADLAASADVRRFHPLLADAASRIGDLQVRNRGTVGGSLAHADPASDLPTAVIALDATVRAQGLGGAREIPATGFFMGPFMTDLREDEVLTEVVIPDAPSRTGSVYRKFAHPASGYAVVSIAAVVTLNGDGAVAACAVAVGGVADFAYRAEGTERHLTGRTPDGGALRAGLELLCDGREAVGDLFASGGYRAHMARVMAEDALTAALAAAGA